MSRTAIRGYKDGDFDQINPLSCYASDPSVKERLTALADMDDRGLSYTIIGRKGKPLAVMGWLQIFSHVAEIWAFTDTEVGNEFVRFSKATKFLIDHEFSRCDSFKRMQITIRADQEWSVHWAEFLGFELEGTLKQYGEDNCDYHMFARVRSA